MLAELEKGLVARKNLGRLTWRGLEWVNDGGGAIWKGRGSCVTPLMGKQGSKVNARELILNPPPAWTTPYIQLASRPFWRWAALPILHLSILLLAATRNYRYSERFYSPRAYRVCISATDETYAKPFPK